MEAPHKAVQANDHDARAEGSKVTGPSSSHPGTGNFLQKRLPTVTATNIQGLSEKEFSGYIPIVPFLIPPLTGYMTSG